MIAVTRNQEAIAELNERARGKRSLILVIDDDDDVRRSIADALTLDGHLVVGIQNGEQALGALAVVAPSLVVTDLEMPLLGGAALISKLRSFHCEVVLHTDH